MKKILILSMFVFLVFAACGNSKAALVSEQFLNSLEYCTPYSPGNQITFDGTIVGKTNGKCHVKYPNGSIEDSDTQQRINIGNCYFAMNDTRRIVEISNEIKLFFTKYLGKDTIPTSEESRMKMLMKEYTAIHEKSCK